MSSLTPGKVIIVFTSFFFCVVQCNLVSDTFSNISLTLGNILEDQKSCGLMSFFCAAHVP